MSIVSQAQFKKLMRHSGKVRARGRVRHTPGVMNKLEYEYALYLDKKRADGAIAGFWFEPLKLRLADKTYLTVDFMVMLPDGLIELQEVKAARKGSNKAGEVVSIALVEDDASVKIKVAAEQFPMFQFCLVYKRSGSGIWERKNY